MATPRMWPRAGRNPSTKGPTSIMIIDCHGHYTTSPPAHEAWRRQQVAAGRGASPTPTPRISDDEIRESIINGQLRVQGERGVDMTIFSPRAAGMAHHDFDAAGNAAWSRFMQHAHPSRLPPVPEQFRRRLPAAAVAGRFAGELRRRARALRRRNSASSAATSIPIRQAATGRTRR